MKINQAFEILKHAGGTRAARMIIGDQKKIPWIKVFWAARQLRRGVPVAKIIHEKWFYALKFYTNRHTLDPRPDSETLVSAVLGSPGVHILDLGTGTGCLIAAIVKNLPGATGVGIDKSRGAIRVAKKNIRDLGLADRIKIIRGDFHHQSSITNNQFDVIISNPPYIATGDPRVNDAAMHDPKMALYADDSGLAAYSAIAKNARKWIKPNGKIYLEIGERMGADVRKIFEKQKWKFNGAFNDLGGIERVLVFTFENHA